MKTSIQIKDIELHCGDCFDVMPTIPDGSINLCLTDLPYGVLNQKNKDAQWDKEIDLDQMWNQLLRICAPDAAIVLFGQGLFSAKLMMSQPKLYRYSLIWDKVNRPTGFLDAKRRPLRIHEDILVFYRKQPTYNPQMSIGNKNHSRGKIASRETGCKNRCYGDFRLTETEFTNEKYPTSILSFEKEYPSQYHPTQKSVSVLEYLIRTYSNVGDAVLDFTMGSGSTMVTCANAGRRGIGIEMCEEYYNIAVERVKRIVAQPRLDI